MIVILKETGDAKKISDFLDELKNQGFETHVSKGSAKTIVGIIGDVTKLDTDRIVANGIVEEVKRVSEPFKRAGRKFKPDDTLINVKGVKIGEGSFTVIAGPCSVESEEQMEFVARSVKQSGAALLRGGAFKPRTSPYAFQGLQKEGIRLLVNAGKKAGLPVVTELTSLVHLDLFGDVDVIQVGARNMQNFEMLKELGHIDKPILLKRGMSATLEEFLMSAEYILSGGNDNVILCERGIRTVETMTRNTLDISAVPLVKELSHLPIVIDPSHAAGRTDLVLPLAKAALAAGADGLMIEVHNDPAHALCDGKQSLTPDQFLSVCQKLKSRVAFEEKVWSLK